MRRHVLLGLGIMALGALGYLLAAGAKHLYEDHQRVDQIWDLELRRAAAQQAQQAQQPSPGVAK